MQFTKPADMHGGRGEHVIAWWKSEADAALNSAANTLAQRVLGEPGIERGQWTGERAIVATAADAANVAESVVVLLDRIEALEARLGAQAGGS